jgi:hypothetical protein
LGSSRGTWLGHPPASALFGFRPMSGGLDHHLGKLGSRSQFCELVMAREFLLQFNSVVDDFSPLPPVNVEKYRQAGIRIPKDRNRHRRLFRAERWAKIGLENIWFFLIPARPDVTKNELETVEKELTMVSNAAMFRLFSEGAPRAWPLVNIKHGNIVRNPYVEPRLLQEYEIWLSKRSR